MAVAPPPGSPAPAGGDAADPSMEEILASIRRILNEDDAPPADPSDEATAGDDVLVLDQSMLIAEGGVAEPAEVVAEPEAAAHSADPDDDDDFSPPPLAVMPAASPPEPEPEPVPPEPAPVVLAPPPRPALVESPAAATGADILAPEAAAAAASSISSLVRTLSAGRTTQVYSGGPTLEDMVRAELRPLLKAWLDVYLPPMVERLVRIEIERVVGRAVP